MKIVADANILAVDSYFREHAELVLIPGRAISRADLLDADALLVRSITRVDAALLDGTSVRFVGTATSGTDHIDVDYLASQQIGFAHTRGSNANAVVDYCFTALAFAALHKQRSVEKLEVGIVGAGHVGSRFAARLEQLNIACSLCDPELEQRFLNGEDFRDEWWPARASFCTLEEILTCDVVSLHVPLTATGNHPTRHMLGAAQLAQMADDAILINTCRGGVVDEMALLQRLVVRPQMLSIIDVWEGEPAIFDLLVAQADIATPHIAGYSENAKLASTRMLSESLVQYFALKSALEGPPLPAKRQLPVRGEVMPDSHWQLLLETFPLQQLDAETRALAATGEIGAQFDRLRARLQIRREFCDYAVDAAGFSAEQLQWLTALGFTLLES